MAGPYIAERERRKWQRLPVAIPLFVRGTDDTGAAFLEFTTTLNISAGGVLLILRHDNLSENAELSVEIPAVPTAQAESTRRSLDGQLMRVRHLLGWCVAALEFSCPLLQNGH